MYHSVGGLSESAYRKCAKVHPLTEILNVCTVSAWVAGQFEARPVCLLTGYATGQPRAVSRGGAIQKSDSHIIFSQVGETSATWPRRTSSRHFSRNGLISAVILHGSSSALSGALTEAGIKVPDGADPNGNESQIFGLTRVPCRPPHT